MRRRSTSLLNVAIMLSLAFSGLLSGILVPTTVAKGTTSAPVAVPGEVSPELASRKVKRERKLDRKKKDRTQDRKQNNRKSDRKKKDRQKDRKHERRRDLDLSGGQLPTAEAGQISVEDHYIVVLEDVAGDAEGAAGDLATDGVTPTHVYEHVLNGFAAVIPDDQLADVRNDPRVKAVVQDQEVHAYQQPLPTGIDRIDADLNATARIDGVDQRVDVDVAVLDTGIAAHPDLIVNGGRSCISGNASYADDNGHGTHVAGTVAALDNAIGVVGVAPGARLWAVKVLNSQGSGSWSSVICGLDWVVANSGTIDVANMSLGGDGSDSICPGSDPLHNAICKVVNAGIPLVVAAGNDRTNAANAVPAAYDEVITVSALADSNGKPGGGGAPTSAGSDDTLATFSNFGADVDIAAPGVSVLSTIPGGRYARFSGTSMASPHVAGAAALYLANNPSATPAQVKTALLSTREAIALPNDPDGIHEGVLNVASDPGPPPLPPAPQPPSPQPSTASPPPPTADTSSPKKEKKDKKKKKKGNSKSKKNKR